MLLSSRLLRDTPYILMYEREGFAEGEAEEAEGRGLPRALMEEIERDNAKHTRDKQGIGLTAGLRIKINYLLRVKKSLID